MNCNQCNNLGLVIVRSNGDNDPMWNDPKFRVFTYDGKGHNIVMDCQCREDNPVGDDLYKIVTEWVEEGRL